MRSELITKEFQERFIDPIKDEPDDSLGVAWGRLVSKKELIEKGFTLIGYPEEEKYNCNYKETICKHGKVE
jgi:hypothetical protein